MLALEAAAGNGCVSGPSGPPMGRKRKAGPALVLSTIATSPRGVIFTALTSVAPRLKVDSQSAPRADGAIAQLRAAAAAAATKPVRTALSDPGIRDQTTPV